jgi:hypothetical protein
MNHDNCICVVGVSDGRTIFSRACEVHGWDEADPAKVDRRHFNRETRKRAERFAGLDAPASAKVWKAK